MMLITRVIQNLHPASLLPHTLTQIRTCMTSASAGKEGDGNVRLADFSGHDTVISSIFAALGVWQKGSGMQILNDSCNEHHYFAADL